MFGIFLILLFLLGTLVTAIEEGEISTAIFCLIFGGGLAFFSYMIMSEKDLSMIKEDIKNKAERTKWKNAFKNSTIVKEFTNYINSNYVHNIAIYKNRIVMDGKTINYSEKDVDDLTVEGTRALAEELKNKLRFKILYKISDIREYSGGGYVGSNRLIGFREGPNGYMSAEYAGDSSGPSYTIVGYELKLNLKYESYETKNEKVDKTKSWAK